MHHSITQSGSSRPNWFIDQQKGLEHRKAAQAQLKEINKEKIRLRIKQIRGNKNMNQNKIVVTGGSGMVGKSLKKIMPNNAYS